MTNKFKNRDNKNRTRYYCNQKPKTYKKQKFSIIVTIMNSTFLANNVLKFKNCKIIILNVTYSNIKKRTRNINFTKSNQKHFIHRCNVTTHPNII